MFMERQVSAVLLAMVISVSFGLTACGGSSSSSGGGADITSGDGGGTGGGGTGGNGGGTGGGDGGGNGDGGGGSTAFSGVEGPLDPVQSEVSNIVRGQLGAALPAPLGSTVMCADEAVEALVDGPDALLAAFAALPGGADPAEAFNGAAADISATMQLFAAKLQSTLMILSGQSSLCDESMAGGNPFEGTPLEPLGIPLSALISALQSAGDGSNSGDDPNLSVVAATITPLIDQLVAAFGMLPVEVTSAPVAGAVLATVQDALGDLSTVLTAAGDYDPIATQAAIETMLGNALTNVLLNVVPVSDIEAATGQDFSTDINAGIATLTAEFGGVIGMLITPAFNDGLDGAFSPLLDPVEGLLSQLLAAGDMGTGNPLDGLIGDANPMGTIAGDGASPLDALLALLTSGADGTPLADLVSSFPDAGTGTPLDDLMILADPANASDLDSILGALGTLFGGTPLGDALDGILGGLGSLSP